VNQALNAGLALSSDGRLAPQDLTGRADPAVIPLVYRLLEEAAIDLYRKQYLDLHVPGARPPVTGYMEKIRLKTGVLIGVSCQVGAVIAGFMDQAAAARRFGEALGVAFQLQDDYLGVWGQPETLGKAPNDLEERKRSLPVVLAGQEKPEAVATLLATPGEAATAELLGLLDDLAIRPRVQALAQEAAGEALRALKELQLKPPWEGRFEQLIQFVVARAV
jgi:geranylgeranyl diphosphate synthase type I